MSYPIQTYRLNMVENIQRVLPKHNGIESGFICIVAFKVLAISLSLQTWIHICWLEKLVTLNFFSRQDGAATVRVPGLCCEGGNAFCSYISPFVFLP